MKAKIKKILMKSPKLYTVARYFYRFVFFDMINLIRYKKLEKTEYIIVPNKSIIYLNNSKVACSSIKSTFIDESIPDDYSIHNKIKNLRREYYTEEESNYFKFTFVRNPFDRLVSCYESKYRKDKKMGKQKLHFDEYLFGYIKKDNGFEDFVRKVVKLPDHLADRHFQSQYNLIYDRKGKSRVDFIGKYENLTEDFKDIKDQYNLRDLPHFNNTGKRNWMDYYNIDTARMVRKKYANEIEKFGYEEEYNILIEYLNKKENRNKNMNKITS
ncbi:sulfotransferase family 2 domain-containing protein [Bacillus solimangrovi]|uniref:Sulfotransferase family protein n=1 Tax=Bacillus solimangrovi TaxID=1305675 RepID=A0A1E5LDI5_9BACI|nr:sulfotransferase family 2 domain-containing protein [Bacillus solimangrovi]OEH92145.1 hypothetical protein BFG57_02410 [Bacillus solimangrovi]